MPHRSGLALLAGLRRRAAGATGGADPAAGRPVVILISAILSPELRVEAARLGVTEVLEKPIDTAHLLASVRTALAGLSCPDPAKPPAPL
jgi:CheY-like chemotaxis protein